MNERVRKYLIEVARTSDRFVSYTDVNRDCNLGLNFDDGFGNIEVGRIVGDVSKYEHENGRPLLSSLTISKDENDAGIGFYRLAEKLGKGKFKKLKDELFVFEEAKECRKFWKDDNNYRQYNQSPSAISNHTDEMPFFTIDELEFFKQWQNKAYDPQNEEHIAAKNYLMATVWEKSVYLGKLIVQELEGFKLDGKRIWHQRGWKEEDGQNVQAAIFKTYTWVKIFREEDKGREIFFTFGVDAWEGKENFLYKIDLRDTRDSKLSEQQKFLFKQLLPASARWNDEISYGDLVKMDWPSLTKVCVDFVNSHLDAYDAIIEAVWGKPIPSQLFKGKLVRREKPENGLTTPPEHSPSFTGIDRDQHQSKLVGQKDLGDAGEALVKQHEIDYLQHIGRQAYADRVEIVEDGKGYDVLSFDENGNEKYIEVKTTTGNENSSFYLSETEVAFMRSNQQAYRLYRVYNYDAANSFGEFYELNGDVESQLLMRPTQFQVWLRKQGA